MLRCCGDQACLFAREFTSVNTVLYIAIAICNRTAACQVANTGPIPVTRSRIAHFSDFLQILLSFLASSR